MNLAYWPDSPLARIPVGIKLLFTTALGFLALLRDDPLGIGIAMGLTALLYVVGRIPLRALARTLRGVLPFVVVIAIFETIRNHPLDGAVHGARLLTFVALGALITFTTSWDEMIRFVRRLLQPLQPLGVNPNAVALAAGMTLRFVPLLSEVLDETKDAFIARGIKPRRTMLLFPVIRRALLLAQDVGLALAAREPYPPSQTARRLTRG